MAQNSKQGRHSAGSVRAAQQAAEREEALRQEELRRAEEARLAEEARNRQIHWQDAPVDNTAHAMRPAGSMKPVKKKHTGLKVFLVILLILVVAAAVVGYNGYQLYQSAMRVADDGKAIMAQVNTLEPAIKSGDTETLRATLQDIEKRSANMKTEVNGDLWNFAAGLPRIGQDIKNAQALVGVLDDVSTNALAPIEQNAEVLQLSGLVHDGAIDTDAFQRLSNIVMGALPVFERAEQILSREQIEIRQNQLSAEVEKKADADKYQIQKNAEADLEQRKRVAEAQRYEAEQRALAQNAASDATRYQLEQEAQGIKAKGEAEAYAILKKGEAEAMAMDKKAEAYKKYNNAAIAQMMIEVLPQIVENVAKPISAIKDVKIYSGGEGQNGISTLSGNVPVAIKQAFDVLQSATGVDMADIMRAGTIEAKTTRNINVDGLDGLASKPKDKK